jgi:hypothetical protein
MNFVDIKCPENNDYTLSKEKYWEIRGCATGSINSEGTFFVSMAENNLDSDFEDVVLLYRKDNASEFKPIKINKIIHNVDEGVLIVKNLQFGQYIVATKK